MSDNGKTGAVTRSVRRGKFRSVVGLKDTLCHVDSARSKTSRDIIDEILRMRGAFLTRNGKNDHPGAHVAGDKHISMAIMMGNAPCIAMNIVQMLDVDHNEPKWRQDMLFASKDIVRRLDGDRVRFYPFKACLRCNTLRIVF